MKAMRSILAAFAVAVSLQASAQSTKIPFDRYNGMYQFIPKSMSADGVSRLVTTSVDDQSPIKSVTISVYDSEFNQEKAIKQEARVTSMGTTRTMRASGAVEAESYEAEDFTREVLSANDRYDEIGTGSVTEAELENYLRRCGCDFGKTEEGHYYDRKYTEFYAYNFFGEKYPIAYMCVKEGRAVSMRARYSPDFTGSNWTESNWVNYEYSDELVCSFILRDLNEDKEYSDGEPMILSQGIFNDDAKYEFIRTLRKEGATGDAVIMPWPGDDNPIKTESVNVRNFGVAGYEVVSEDGNVVLSIEIDDEDMDLYDSDLMVLKMNGELYFVVVGRKRNESEIGLLLAYRLDRQSNTIQKVTMPSGIRISPRTLRRSTPVTVSFEQPVQSPSHIVVSSADGKIVSRQSVRIGESSVQISTDRLSSGLYNFTVISNGRKIENGKIIVQ